MYFICFFFFSSRRRHTRSTRDWSSDVCSSDLVASPRHGHSTNCEWRPKPQVSHLSQPNPRGRRKLSLTLEKFSEQQEHLAVRIEDRNLATYSERVVLPDQLFQAGSLLHSYLHAGILRHPTS